MKMYDIYVNGQWVDCVACGSSEEAVDYGSENFARDTDLVYAVEREEGGEGGEE